MLDKNKAEIKINLPSLPSLLENTGNKLPPITVYILAYKNKFLVWKYINIILLKEIFTTFNPHTFSCTTITKDYYKPQLS